MVNVIDHELFLSYIVNGECYQLYVMFILYAKQKFEDTNKGNNKITELRTIL